MKNLRNKAEKALLIINAGSSSIKFAVYNMDTVETIVFEGQIEDLRTEKSSLTCKSGDNNEVIAIYLDTSGANEPVVILIDWLKQQIDLTKLKGIGHRIVHGMNHILPEKITDALLTELRSTSTYDPEHLPEEIKLIERFRATCPDIPQIACFDTSFHTSMPDVAKRLPLPRRFLDKGIRRYGFHGISYAYLMEQLEKTAGHQSARGNVILSHLGSGASLCAVKDGKSVDTSMGFTPASGIPMGTRSGDLDPGIVSFLMESENITPPQYSHLINHESGMLGISETSADMRVLLKAQKSDIRAAEAVELFCYAAKKRIGAFAAVLGGLDTLVFSGGIGEHAPEIRTRICEGLGFLGIEIDEKRNKRNDSIISSDASKIHVRVIMTNEQLMIARSVHNLLNQSSN